LKLFANFGVQFGIFGPPGAGPGNPGIQKYGQHECVYSNFSFHLSSIGRW